MMMMMAKLTTGVLLKSPVLTPLKRSVLEIVEDQMPLPPPEFLSKHGEVLGISMPSDGLSPDPCLLPDDLSPRDPGMLLPDDLSPCPCLLPDGL